MKANQEQATFFFPFVKALMEGKQVRFRNRGAFQQQWAPMREDLEWFMSKDVEDYEFRIVEPPKLRPWKPEEVPVGALIRQKSNPQNRLLIAAVVDGRPMASLWAKDLSGYEWALSPDCCEYSVDPIGTPDNQRTWKPCGVEE